MSCPLLATKRASGPIFKGRARPSVPCGHHLREVDRHDDPDAPVVGVEHDGQGVRVFSLDEAGPPRAMPRTSVVTASPGKDDGNSAARPPSTASANVAKPPTDAAPSGPRLQEELFAGAGTGPRGSYAFFGRG